ncbi:PP2C family protein-serine/threonine phosphatase [Solwaraspora sp. WMMD1047]|uniref:PP2C family protein-serine/threonine phosphatase n=1 Tax=Solwaraspora sp. WMMD1047 TaxID=3016102 RepID=UPI002417739A|nr:PP2C family protein-serine/threonine phosphatase [Solwaraspora sp. WMMD1047]MDG4833849.1 PP2C family protein-serine/threonine phosphatase [Solwaraspora sp. WMMD1047]
MASPGRAMRWLLESAPYVGVAELPTLVMSVAPVLGVAELVIYVVDYTQTRLMPLGGPGVPVREPQAVDGTMAGRAFATGHTQHRTGDGTDRAWLPLAHGCDRLGVLEISTPGSPSAETRDAGQQVATAVTQLLTTRHRYGDSIERARRGEPLQLAAEIMWGLLPPLSFATHQVMVTGILEPCYDIGGDVFDYALNGDVLSVALLDAVGHGTDASLLATLALGAYRNARRCGLGLVDTARSVDKQIHAHQPGRFASAVLVELDCRTGRLDAITAGHPAPLLLRDGRMIKTLDAPTALPLGLGYLARTAPRVVSETLHPGDQLLLYTDGVTEARTEDGEFFGIERLADFVNRALADRLPTPETMRRLVHAILEHQHDRLQDDATALIVEWQPPGHRLQPLAAAASTWS